MFWLRMADMGNMECPRCRSREFRIKKKVGLERLKIWWTGMREYRCLDCDGVFRAKDRRKMARLADAQFDPAGESRGLVL